MEEPRTITMTQKELNRLQIIYKVLEKQMTQVRAGELLELSERQVRRISQSVATIGDQGVIHRLRGCVSHKRLKESKKKRIMKLYESKYEGFGPTLASEKMLFQYFVNYL